MTDDDSSVPSKRRRTEEADTPSDKTLSRRHEKHWYRDGSIVLRVEDTLFRVHQTTLEAQSTVFKDLFRVPQPADGELDEGCSVVRLSHDKVEEWLTMLDALYHSMEYFDALGAQDLAGSFEALSIILRLSTKYRITAYRRKCISLLSRSFPFGPTSHEPSTIPTWEQGQDMINLARATSSLVLLPSAFLTVISNIYDETIYEGLSVSPSDKLLVYNGLLRILRMQRTDIYPFAYNNTKAPTGCRSGGCLKPLSFSSVWTNPDWVIFYRCEVTLPPFACSACKKEATRVVAEGMQRAWSQLPRIFKLAKDWEDLQRLHGYGDTDD